MWTRLSKIAGWLILLAYLANTPLVFEPVWAGLYLAICLGISLVYVFAVEPGFAYLGSWLRREAPGVRRESSAPVSDAKTERFMQKVLRQPLVELLLVPGEDGLFFVPLLLVGVTWWTALPVALLFGLAHARMFSWPASAVKAVCAYVACLVVLPHGILHVVVGHVLLDAIAVAGFALLMEQPSPAPGATLANNALEPTGAASKEMDAPAAQRGRWADRAEN